MNLLLYYIFRRIFVKYNFTADYLILEKGLIFKRKTVLPLKSVVRITIRRNIPARIIGAKEITLYTLRSKTELFLPKNEQPDFIPKCYFQAKPSFGKIAFGAFIDTRALGGVVIFAAILRKIGAVLGGEYSRKIVSLLFATAENISGALAVFHIAVPRIGAALGIFALAAWIFAYCRKLLHLAKFRVGKSGKFIFTASGITTLYEHIIVRNSSAFVLTHTAATLLAKRSPLYCRRVMIFPSVEISEISGVTLNSPKRALLGRLALPLWLSAGFSAGLSALYLSKNFGQLLLLKTVLWSGLLISLYLLRLFFAYSKNAKAVFGKNEITVTERRGLRSYTCYFPADSVISLSLSQNIFQRFSGLCNIELRSSAREKFRIKNVFQGDFLW